MAETTIILTDEDGIRLEIIRNHVKNLWRTISELRGFTIHDQRHNYVVEARLHQLLPPKYADKLSEVEKFLLLSSAWLHDIGLVYRLFGREDEDIFHGDFEEIRKVHELRSEKYVVNNYHQLGLNVNEASVLGLICRFHRRKRNIQECPWISPAGAEQIRVRLLASFLRLADALQDSSRAPDKEYEANIIMNMDRESKHHWLKARYVQGISIDSEKCKIILALKYPPKLKSGNIVRAEEEKKVLDLLRKVLKDELQDEIDSLKDTFMEGGLAMYHTVEDDEGGGFATPYTKDMDELIGTLELNLSPNASQVRDAIFNKVLILTDRYDQEDNARISLKHLIRYRDTILPEFLKRRPCHVIVQKLLGELKKNMLYKEELTEKNIYSLRTNHCIKIIEKIRNRIIKLQEEKNEYWKKFESRANLLKFEMNEGILLYGNSNSVASFLCGINADIRKTITLYICQCATKTLYGYNNRLRYCDALEYAARFENRGFRRIKFLPDACVAHLLTQGDNGIYVKKVFFGANGVNQYSGDVAHSAGHLTIAYTVAETGRNQKKEIYVIADTMKMGDFMPKLELQRENNWLSTDMHYRPSIGSQNIDLYNFGEYSYNPLEDIIPYKLITKIIPEKGNFKPKKMTK